MKRYLYYLIFVNMLVNVVAYVPKLLIRERFDGAVMAIPAGIAVGAVLMFAGIRCMQAFPGEGLPEIYARTLPAWIGKPLLLLFAAVWFSAGLLQLLVYARYTMRFINPDIPETVIYTLFTVAVLFAARFKSTSILFLIEMLLLIGTPLISFILVKSLFSAGMRYDSVLSVLQSYRKPPDISSIAAISFLFSGYANLVVFNRILPKSSMKWLLLLLPVGFAVACTSFFIPVGYLGSDGVQTYVFPWMSATDAMRVELGFIERVMYVFYSLYGEVTFASIIMVWHVALELVKSVLLPPQAGRKRTLWTWVGMGVLFLAATHLTGRTLTDEGTFRFGEMWINIRLALEIFFVLTLWFAVRRRKA
ncbi:GerAB/ArcD/ProY family transporter [Gorillibacterium sp. sgz5001074]|uniref:GerAB/ArcD/ProY family transporter n=1 Tax=Gorillibacterium sp. sgz5001074 TaxID=3446695 RepID=UPI003F67BC42